MFSLNVPLPGEVAALVARLRPRLGAFESIRTNPTLVVKRFGRIDGSDVGSLQSEVRLTLAGMPAFEARVSRVEAFEAPAAGPAPVLYLAVESPGLETVHDRLVGAFGVIDGIEGDDYVPHITLARGGEVDLEAAITGIDFDPISWTVRELWFWDARHDERVAQLALSA